MIERRQYLSGIATGVVGLCAGIVGTNVLTQSARAQVDMGDFKLADGEKTTRDGTIEDITVVVDGNWSYDVPSAKDPHKWQVVLWAKRSGEKEPLAVDEGQARYLSGNGEYSLEASLLGSRLWANGDFEEGTDGEAKRTDVALMVVFNVFNPSEKVIAQATVEQTATVKVTNEGYVIEEHGDVSGEGGVTVIG